MLLAVAVAFIMVDDDWKMTDAKRDADDSPPPPRARVGSACVYCAEYSVMSSAIMKPIDQSNEIISSIHARIHFSSFR